jgi:hypothetical protein
MWLESIRSEDTYFNWDDPSVMMEYKKNPLYFRNVIDEKIKNKPVALFEAKVSDSSISKPGKFYSKKLNIPLFQIVHKAKKVEAFPGNCFIIPASNFLMLTG